MTILYEKDGKVFPTIYESDPQVARTLGDFLERLGYKVTLS